jgi:hypothetical protein
MSSPISRGFSRLRRPSDGEQGRVPPGPYVTQDFPVLLAGRHRHLSGWRSCSLRPPHTPWA